MAGRAVLGLSNAGFAYGATPVFSGVTFTLDDARTALVGDNGAGKSTLLKCLTGELALTEGQVVKSRGVRTGYMAQDIPHTLLTMTLRQILESYLHDPDASWEVDVLLYDLGIAAEKADMLFSTFSGGWQRLALVAAITNLQKPDIFILDEPTNHLDLAHLYKLEDWLLNHTKIPLLIVSHDREFLARITNRTVFLRSDGAHYFSVGFPVARQELLQRDAANAAARATEEKEIDRLRKMANRYKAWGVLNSDFHKKMKNTEKRIDKMRDEQTQTYVKKERNLELSESDLSARTALLIEHHVVETPDGRALYKIDRLAVRPGDCIALLGDNGSGKSTLLRAIAKAYNPHIKHYDSSAAIKFNPGTRLMTFDQKMDALPLDITPMDYMRECGLTAHSNAAAVLAKAGFNYQRATIGKIASLSYGERSRLLFLGMKLMQPNLYILDEPTNHLDIEGQEALEEQLSTQDVSCILVSHDRHFVRTAATRYIEIQKTKTGARLVELDDPEAFFARYETEEAA